MSDNQSLDVDLDELAAHAADVRRVAERVRRAHQAADTHLDQGSTWYMYGLLLNSTLGMPTHMYQTNVAIGLVDGAAGLLEACADGLEDERLCYEELDHNLAELLKRTGMELDS